MDKYLKPPELNIDPKSPSAEDEWDMWITKFGDFFNSIDSALNSNKLTLLRAHMSCACYKLIKSATTYDEAVKMLESRFVKPHSEVYDRHKLASRRQQAGESLDTYLEELGVLASQCKFEAATAEKVKEDAIRDAFINGLASSAIRQRLLENIQLDLKTAVSQARALEMAQQQSETYHRNNSDSSSMTLTAHAQSDPPMAEAPPPAQQSEVTAAVERACFFCGGPQHARSKCRARNATCPSCGKQGHFASVCQMGRWSRRPQPTKDRRQTTASMPILSAMHETSLPSLRSAMTHVTINGQEMEALIRHWQLSELYPYPGR